MKKILIKCIKLYQMLPLSMHRLCKFTPTCSEYGISAIEEYGCLKGLGLTIKRIIKCNPFSKGGYDPLIRRKNEKI